MADNPYFPYRVVHYPAACVESCEDDDCPYIHKPHWDILLRDVFCEGPFDSREEAEAWIANNRGEASKDSTCVTES